VLAALPGATVMQPVHERQPRNTGRCASQWIVACRQIAAPQIVDHRALNLLLMAIGIAMMTFVVSASTQLQDSTLRNA
jgi:hypothetical protein